MGKNYKTVKNGRGTELVIDDQRYISVGMGGTDVTIRGDGMVLSFDRWDDFISAVNVEKAAYYECSSPDGVNAIEK